MGQAKTCVLFMAHYLNSSILKEFYKLKECRRPGFDVKFFYDNSRGDFQRSKFKDEQDYALFTAESIQQRYTLVPYWGDRRALIYGNLIFPMLSFALDNSYQYIWRIEFDVRFSGKWIDFFKVFESSEADLLGTTIYRFSSCPAWCWWETMEKDGAPIPKDKLIKGFFPVMRLSKRACDILDQAYHNGWKGHWEGCVGTILNYFNCKIEDIGGDGEFVNQKNRNRFYQNTPQNVFLYPGTFVWRLPKHWMAHSLSIPGHLYHPVVPRPWFYKLYLMLIDRSPRLHRAIKFIKRYIPISMISKKPGASAVKAVDKNRS